jgi:ATP-binding cassette, subfamily G (WHITE), member 2, PDR
MASQDAAADEIHSSSPSVAETDEETQEGTTVRRYESIRLDAQETEELTRIARVMSRQWSAIAESRQGRLTRMETVTGIPEDSPVFDPNRSEFDLYKWVKRNLHGMDEKGIKLRRAGITFKDLHVSGSGASLNLQQTVSSSITGLFRFGEAFRSRNIPEKKILRNFDGVLKSGELLVVLGRPGSGCSTLLKTLCGEMYGLKTGENSVIHYNGIIHFQGNVKRRPKHVLQVSLKKRC